MATLATQSIDRAGVTPSYASAAGGGDRFTPGKRTFLHVKNGSGGAITVTVATPREAFPDVATADLAVSVTAGSERMIGPFPPEFFASTSDGLADVTYSGVTSLTVACLEVTAP